MRQRLIDSLYKPLIDPNRVERTFRHFDDKRGFARYQEICRASFRRHHANVQPTMLAERGFEYVPILPPEAAQELLAQIRGEGPARVKKDSPKLLGHRLDDSLRQEVLDAVLQPTLDARLTGFFLSEYLVYWMSVTVTAADPESATVSFRWHCDKGPSEHLKLIVYLNGSAEHGGNTEFISRVDTTRVAQRGYVFGRTRSRTGDVSKLSRIAGHAIRPHQQPMRAGEGVMFQPARVLHRGVVPTRAQRYAVTLCMLPSPIHWREALHRGTMVDLAVDDKWPDHADELLKALRIED